MGSLAVSSHQHVRRQGRGFAPADDVELLGRRLRQRLLVAQGLAQAKYVEGLKRRRLRRLLRRRDLTTADDVQRLP